MLSAKLVLASSVPALARFSSTNGGMNPHQSLRLLMALLHHDGGWAFFLLGVGVSRSGREEKLLPGARESDREMISSLLGRRD